MPHNRTLKIIDVLMTRVVSGGSGSKEITVIAQEVLQCFDASTVWPWTELLCFSRHMPRNNWLMILLCFHGICTCIQIKAPSVAWANITCSLPRDCSIWSLLKSLFRHATGVWVDPWRGPVTYNATCSHIYWGDNLAFPQKLSRSFFKCIFVPWSIHMFSFMQITWDWQQKNLVRRLIFF